MHQMGWFNTWKGHKLICFGCNIKLFLVMLTKQVASTWLHTRHQVLWLLSPGFTEQQFSPKLKFKVKDRSSCFGMKTEQMTEITDSRGSTGWMVSALVSLCCWRLEKMTFKNYMYKLLPWQRSHSASSSSSSSLSCIGSSSPAQFSNSPVSEFHIHLICTLNSAISMPKSFYGQKKKKSQIQSNATQHVMSRLTGSVVKRSRTHQNTSLLRSEHVPVLTDFMVLKQCHHSFHDKMIQNVTIRCHIQLMWKKDWTFSLFRGDGASPVAHRPLLSKNYISVPHPLHLQTCSFIMVWAL